jgi:MFS family permease
VNTRPTAKAPAPTGLSAAARATYVAFIGCGFAFASWASRYGRVRVIRGQTVLAIAGVLVFVFSPATPLAFAGVLLWGIGASLGFPAGMSAAADDPAAAAGRVSVVASIGYCAFLGGPPLIGYLGQNVTVLRALIAVAVVLALATLVTGALRPLSAHPPTCAGDPEVSSAGDSTCSPTIPSRNGGRS